MIRVLEMAQPGSSLEKKYLVALVAYAVLGVLSWFTLDARIAVGGKLVELKLVPLVIIGGLALRTVVAMKAEKIRQKDSESAKVFESRIDRKVGM